MKEHFNTKYSLALRERVIRYYKTHTARECAKKFGLTHGQMIGLLETSRRKGLLSPNFKDTRTKNPWTLKEWRYLIQRAGLRPRGFIALKLNRGSARVIKERLRVNGNCGSKWLNGMPREWAVQLWGERAPCGFKTDAGPKGFIVVPWTECEILSRKHKTDSNVKAMIRAMSKFQKLIYGVNSNKGIKIKIRRILRER